MSIVLGSTLYYYFNKEDEVKNRKEYLLRFLFPIGTTLIKIRRRWLELDAN
jgi:hypothetical protein